MCQNYGGLWSTLYFQCTNGLPKCLPPLWVCDGERECEDGSDEALEVCSELQIGINIP